jgi:hypothetical protein
MNKEKLNMAISNIDCDLVDEFINEREEVQKARKKRRTVALLAPLAACLVLFIAVGSAFLGYNLGIHDKPSEEGEQLQIFFENEGTFIFEYSGKRYMAYVAPMLDGINEPISIKNVGELISTVDVVDEKGNVAALEIYSSKSDSDGGILLKLGSGYFLASGIDKSARE